MIHIKYLIQFFLAIIFFIIFKVLGANLSSKLSGKIFEIIGPFFRSKKLIYSNIKKAFPNIKSDNSEKISKLMWNNYGRVFAEYMFIKEFRNGKLASKIKIEGNEILEEIKNSNRQVVFISGHFANFELMAMQIEKSGIKLSAIYRPLNNIFLNKIMEDIRKKYICKNQIPKGIKGTKDLLKAFKDGSSVAIMIDQRVSEGKKILLLNKTALTSTIPAQLVKRYNCKIVPVYVERKNNHYFNIEFSEPLKFHDTNNLEEITLKLNIWLEQMIKKRPSQWIWTHNRWKL